VNRTQRRAQAGTAAAKRELSRVAQASSVTSTDVCDGVCRACSRQRQLFLPARICGRCIDTAMQQAAAMTPEQARAMLAALDEMEDESNVS
jgi:hypothetical protein